MKGLFPRLLLVSVGALIAGDAAAMRCNSRVIAPGDHEFQVRERCGEPYWTASYGELLVLGAGGPVERRVEQVYDEWYYNFGPRRLVHRLTFRDGRLLRIDTLGYGSLAVGERCSDRDLRRGATPGEIVLRCGEPESRSARYRDILYRDTLGNERVRPVRHEEWLFLFPGSRWARLATFIDGRLSSVERLPH